MYIYFAKTKPNAVIPSKRDEDAGYDLYPCFEEDLIKIPPHKTTIIPLGIASAFSKEGVMILHERGSTGTKGIAQRCGVIDSGYRGEWMAPITNTTDKPIIIVKKDYYEENKKKAFFYNATVYPYEKAICQALFVPLVNSYVKELPLSELLKIESERGLGKLGSSGK